MSNLAIFSTALAVVGFLLHGPLAVQPGWAREGLREFPRHVWAGRILTAIGLGWVTYLLLHSSLGWLETFTLLHGTITHEHLLYVAAPVVYLLIVCYADELLAPRAFGGLLLLVASPLLDAARWQATPARLFVVVLAYLWVLVGMLLVLSPYRFRTGLAWWIENDARCRALGGAMLALDVALLLLAVFVY